jgi:primase-polymerase (primpol)-like protein
MPREIAAEMQAVRRWVGWRYRFVKGKWTKVPYCALLPQREASSTDPFTWATFADVMAAYLAGHFDGIGFVLGDGWIGLDIDGCRNPETGAIDPDALRYIRLLNTYSELSPGQTGVHGIAHGVKPGPRCRVGPFELYADARYFTVTGYRLAELPDTVEERTAQIAELYHELFGPDALTTAPTECGGSDLTDDALLALAQRNAKFAALWSGDCSGYQSRSEADCALCCFLSYWTGRDPARIDALFRRSGLHRQKWDREDYRRRTIAHAVAVTDGVFSADVPFAPLEPDMPVDDMDLNTAPGTI